MNEESAPPDFDPAVPSVARVYDYILGGKDHFAADRAAGDAVTAAFPGLVVAVKANRAFLGRVVRYLAGEAGIRQFLDVGTGIPTAGNTHEVAQAIAPQSRVVYVDNDPVVLAHARALLTSSPEGECAYIDSDMRDTGKVLRAAADTLDFSRPVAVMLVSVLHFAPDEDVYQLVPELIAAVAPGSYLAISHAASDIDSDAMAAILGQRERTRTQQAYPRSRDMVSRLFDSLDMISPGIVPLHQWRPDSDLTLKQEAVAWGAVARKP